MIEENIKIYTTKYLLDNIIVMKKRNLDNEKKYSLLNYKEFKTKPIFFTIIKIDNNVNLQKEEKIYTKVEFYKKCFKYIFHFLDNYEKEDLLRSLTSFEKEYLNEFINNKFQNNIKRLTKSFTINNYKTNKKA